MIELDVIDAKAADTDSDGLRFWRSTPERSQSSLMASGDGAAPEFGEGMSEPPSGASRRQFLQLMGAAMAMAGLTACRRPVQKILPYAEKPEEIIPGVPQRYATGMPFRGTLRPLLVESHEGRPTKVEGNKRHPSSQGSTSPFEQASVLNLYDPDRSQRLLREGSEASWDDFVSFARELSTQAGTVAVLAEPNSSPTMAALREQLDARFDTVQWIPYAAAGNDNRRLGMQQAFGRPLRPRYALDAADVIVSLDDDFLDGRAADYLHNSRTFAQGRELDGPEDEMSRLYAIESTFSVTGGMADHRLPMKASAIGAFAAALARELGLDASGGDGLDDKQQIYAREIARDLAAAGPNAVVMAGEEQPPAVHALAMAINGQLGSIGTTVELLETGESSRPAQDEALAALVDDMNAGAVDALFMLGVNPVYSTPSALGFEEALTRVPSVVHTGLHVDESARAAHWHIPQAHYLEAWGDGRAYDGTLSVVQPLIAPLYDDAKSPLEVLNLVATGTDVTGYDLVRQQWRQQLDAADFESAWRTALHDGFVAGSQYPAASVAAPAPPALATGASDGMEVVFRLDPKVLDGRFSNNAWMQELPDPTTKIVWDNVATMSQATAEKLNVSAEYSEGNFYSDTVAITIEGESVELPVWVQPGMPDDTVLVTLGYGRYLATNRPERHTNFFDTDDYTDIYSDGPIAGDWAGGTREYTVGRNVSPLRPSGRRFATGATVEKTDAAPYMIATTQEEGSMMGRPIARWATLDEYRENPEFVEDMGPPVPGEEGETFESYPTLWQDDHPSESRAYKDNPYHDNQWGMVIDLNTCTGCNACVVACTAENNVQVVGKEEVSRGRHMYWMRTDRYYVSDGTNDDNPEMLMQPVLCQHCENAPCESVCPVAATVHSPDGMNQMIYNRCIGTRYCANNCPYKVRRFNFYNWTKTLPLSLQMQQNPDVTMRFRGVMEKCSFCVQRIRDGQRQADNEQRDLRPNEIETACQEACPTNAITFGDLNNEDSAVVQKRKNSRRYQLLGYLNTKPRVSYLGRVRNVNDRLVQALDALAA
ncbi:Fe-S cluster-containing hydrogenase [Salisaeta longa]|uniref:Fe-S cluster-containing hydrogenase n=1 Tax=Salisaeta longa TaxID=503170 RepID=UPI0003B6B91B|nr:Fe-S cluster-containing hydrogenase [Salisaeta longa]